MIFSQTNLALPGNAYHTKGVVISPVSSGHSFRLLQLTWFKMPHLRPLIHVDSSVSLGTIPHPQLSHSTLVRHNNVVWKWDNYKLEASATLGTWFLGHSGWQGQSLHVGIKSLYLQIHPWTGAPGSSQSHPVWQLESWWLSQFALRLHKQAANPSAHRTPLVSQSVTRQSCH